MLPEGNTRTSWPPEAFEPVFEEMARHDAWWRGDIDAITETQGAVDGRTWYGRRKREKKTGTNEQPKTVHVPVPADIATASADLLFSEPPRFVMPGEHGTDKARDELQARLENIFGTDQAHAALLEGAEIASALGGTYPRITWHADSEHVELSCTDADVVVPEFQNGRLTAATFWTEYTIGRDVYRHLERHEPGRILHGLYEGRDGELGRQVPLAELPELQWAADLVNHEGAILTGIDDLTVRYVANMRPNKTFRRTPGMRDLGRSDFDGVEHLFEELDEVFTSWMRDVRLARARLIVAEEMLDVVGPGKAGRFNTDQEVFATVNADPETMQHISAHQFEIRVEEHSATCEDLTTRILRRAGLADASFGADDDRMQTATGVKARERLSERTRDKKSRYWASELGPLSRAALNLDAHLFGRPRTDVTPEVKWPPSATADTAELAQTASLLASAQAASVETLVRLVHPEWDGDAVNTEVARIREERGLGVAPDPATFKGI